MSESVGLYSEAGKEQAGADPSESWPIGFRKSLEAIKDPQARAEEVRAVELWSAAFANQIKDVIKGGSLFTRDVLNFKPGEYVLNGKKFGTIYQTPLGEHGRTYWNIALPFTFPDGYKASKEGRSPNYFACVRERTLTKLAELLNGELRQERERTEAAIFDHASQLAKKVGPGEFLHFNRLTEAQIVMPIVEPSGEVRTHMVWQTLDVNRNSESGVSRLFDIIRYRITGIDSYYPGPHVQGRLRDEGHEQTFGLRLEFSPMGECIDERPARYRYVPDRGVEYGTSVEAADVYPVGQSYYAWSPQNQEYLSRNKKVQQIERSRLRPPEKQPQVDYFVQRKSLPS